MDSRVSGAPSPGADVVQRFVRLCLCARLSWVGRAPAESRNWPPAAWAEAHRLTTEAGFDWEQLSQVVTENRLAPLLYQAVRDQGLVPAEVEAALRAVRDTNAVRDSLMQRELVQILGSLEQAGVAVIVLKGAALAHTVYGDLALRPMGDLDLLLHAADVPVALQILAGLGFQPDCIAARPGADLAYESQVMVRKPGRIEILVEVHWTLFDSPFYQQHLPLDWLWQTAAPVQIGEQAAWVLGPEAQVVHLCGHLALHHGSASTADLLWRHDVAEVLASCGERLDWDALLARAEACRLALALQRVLVPLAEEGCVPLPVDLRARLAALEVTAEEAQVAAWLAAEERPVAQRFRADLASMAGWRARLGYAWIQLFPSAEYMRQRYRIRHWLLVPLYYPYRWWVGLRSAVG
jgi:hypothetical protein